MTLLRFPQVKGRIVETASEQQFAASMEGVDDARVQVWVQVRDSVRDPWVDAHLWYEGRWNGKGSAPRPSLHDVVALAASVGARFARTVERSVV